MTDCNIHAEGIMVNSSLTTTFLQCVVSRLVFFEQTPIVTPLLGHAQRDGPPFDDPVLSFVDPACDEKFELCKLTWEMQH